jgi:AcrR family transcriptional regulator
MKLEGARSYRMTVRARSVEETRRRILDAAVAAFWAVPTTDISLDDVAGVAGVSVQTVLRHFGTKQRLFEAAVERESGRISRQRDTAVPGDLAAAVRVLVDHYEDVGDGVLRVLAEEHHNPGLVRIADLGRRSHREWCRRVFAGALAPLDGEDRERRLAQLVAVCDVYTWRLIRRDAGLTRQQTETALRELLAPLVEGS